MIEVKTAQLEPFKHFWQLDNPAWIAQREQEWKLLAHAFTEKGMARAERQSVKAFYLLGELTSIHYSPFSFLLTPFSTPEEARDFYYSKFYSVKGRGEIHRGFLATREAHFTQLPWFRDKMKAYVAGVLGQTYQQKFDPFYPNRVITSNPGAWSQRYFTFINWVLTGRGYVGILDALPYFISCLANNTEAEYRDTIDIDQLFITAAQALKQPADPYALEMATKLFENEQALRDAWALNAHLDK